MVFTDGACSNNQDARFRRAGVGVYWNDNHALNCSIPLPGDVQTNQRAELYAVILVLEGSAGRVHVRSDS
eukprot:4397091-Karenia_brevis.AAC.1